MRDFLSSCKHRHVYVALNSRRWNVRLVQMKGARGSQSILHVHIEASSVRGLDCLNNNIGSTVPTSEEWAYFTACF